MYFATITESTNENWNAEIIFSLLLQGQLAIKQQFEEKVSVIVSI